MAITANHAGHVILLALGCVVEDLVGFLDAHKARRCVRVIGVFIGVVQLREPLVRTADLPCRRRAGNGQLLRMK